MLAVQRHTPVEYVETCADMVGSIQLKRCKPQICRVSRDAY
jgi:hypothetical protein